VAWAYLLADACVVLGGREEGLAHLALALGLLGRLELLVELRERLVVLLRHALEQRRVDRPLELLAQLRVEWHHV